MNAADKRLTLLAGGTGAAKFVEGLVRVFNPGNVSIVSNTADDIELHGLSISPDVDIMLYTLAGIVDSVKGWGIRGDTFEALDALAKLGEETWFKLGDRDIATHVVRTHLKNQGWPATRIARYLAESLAVQARVLPMTDAKVFTEVHTDRGWMHFQEFLVKHECRPDILDVAYRGATAARAGDEVIDALETADGIIICPSNPVASIGPILSIANVRETLEHAAAVRVAVCPLIGGKSLKGPSDRMMRAKGFSPDARGVADIYRGLIDGLVIDRVDAHFQKEIESAGIRVLVADTVMSSLESKSSLADRVVEFMQILHDPHRHSDQKSFRR